MNMPTILKKDMVSVIKQWDASKVKYDSLVHPWWILVYFYVYSIKPAFFCQPVSVLREQMLLQLVLNVCKEGTNGLNFVKCSLLKLIK